MAKKSKNRKVTDRSKRIEQAKRLFQSNCLTFSRGSDSAKKKAFESISKEVEKQFIKGKDEALYDVLISAETQRDFERINNVFNYLSETIELNTTSESEDTYTISLFTIPYMVSATSLNLELENTSAVCNILRESGLYEHGAKFHVSKHIHSMDQIPASFIGRHKTLKSLYEEFNGGKAYTPEHAELEDDAEAVFTDVFFIVGLAITKEPTITLSNIDTMMRSEPEREEKLHSELTSIIDNVEHINAGYSISFTGEASKSITDSITYLTATSLIKNLKERLVATDSLPEKCYLRFTFGVNEKGAFCVEYNLRDAYGEFHTNYFPIPSISLVQANMKSLSFINSVGHYLSDDIGFEPSRVVFSMMKDEFTLSSHLKREES